MRIDPAYLYLNLILNKNIQIDKRLFQDSEFVNAMKKIAADAIQRNILNNSLIIYLRLIKNNIEVSQKQLISSLVKSNNKNINDTIKSLYLTNSDFTDLHVNYAQQNFEEREKWVEFAHRDLNHGKIGITWLANSTTLSVNFGQENTFIKDIIRNFKNIENIKNAKSFQIIPILSQAVKLCSDKEITKLLGMLNKEIAKDTLNLCYSVALVENGKLPKDSCCTEEMRKDPAYLYLNLILKNNIQIDKRLFQDSEFVNAMKKIAADAIQRIKSPNAFLVYDYLIRNKIQFSINQALSAITIAYNTNQKLNVALNFIRLCYSNNPHHLNLNFYLSQKLLNEDCANHRWFEIALYDLKNKRMNLIALSKFVTKAHKLGNLASLSKAVENYIDQLFDYENCNFITLTPIFSFILKNIGLEKLNNVIERLTIFINKSDLLAAQLCSLAENNLPLPSSFNLETLESGTSKYLYLLMGQNYKVEKFNSDQLALLALSLSNRKFEDKSLHIYNFLFKQKLLPEEHVIHYLRLLRDVSLIRSLNILRQIKEKNWNLELELEFNFTKLLLGEKHNHLLDSNKNLLNAVLLSEHNLHSEAISAIPEKSHDDVSKLWISLILIRAKKLDLALDCLNKISKTTLTAKNLPEHITGIIEKKVNVVRDGSRDNIIKAYLKFRFHNPTTTLKNFTHKAKNQN